MRLMLDAHTAFWTLYEPDQLPLAIARLIADEANDLFVSEASIWELVNKAAAYRLAPMEASPQAFLTRLAELGTTLLPITLTDIVASAILPRHHGDPFDRMLVAQAQAYNLILLTNDNKIPLYDVQTLWR